MSKSWLNTSWPKESDVCDDWLWDVVARNGLSLQDRRDAGSLSLHTRGRTATIMSASRLASKSPPPVLISVSEAVRREQTHGGAADGKIGVMRPPSRVGEEVSCPGEGGRYHCEEVRLHNAEYLYYP